MSEIQNRSDYISWIKFPSIERNNKPGLIDEIRTLDVGCNPGGKWYVTEKIDGSNLSFAISKDEVRMYNRTAQVTNYDQYYHIDGDKYIQSAAFRKLYDLCAAKYDGLSNIVLYGELFGGAYNAPGVKRDVQADRINGRIAYTPSNEFLAFDLLIVYKDTRPKFIDTAEANAMFEAAGVPYIPARFTGTLDECLAYEINFPSEVHKFYGLPEIENNMAEGVVLRPAHEFCLRSGSRAIIKRKTELFTEVIRSKPMELDPEIIEEYRLAAEKAAATARQYVNDNRLRNVLSHMNRPVMEDFGKVLGELAKDAYKDWSASLDNGAEGEYTENEIKSIRKALSQESANLLKERMNAIVAGTY